ALGDAVPVAPVVARHAVSRGQARAHAGGDGLLAHVGMHGPVDLAGHAQRDGPLVELADEDHRAEHLHRLWLVERHGVTSLAGILRQWWYRVKANGVGARRAAPNRS